MRVLQLLSLSDPDLHLIQLLVPLLKKIEWMRRCFLAGNKVGETMLFLTSRDKACRLWRFISREESVGEGGNIEIFKRRPRMTTTTSGIFKRRPILAMVEDALAGCPLFGRGPP